MKKEDNLYSSTGIDNLEYALADGSPLWYTINVFTGLEKGNLQYTAGIDNLLDNHIRTFSSGVSKSGANYWFRINYNF